MLLVVCGSAPLAAILQPTLHPLRSLVFHTYLPGLSHLLLYLHSLVFHTYLPKLGGASSGGAEGGMEGAPPLLAEYAPLLLRGLYERDVRWVINAEGATCQSWWAKMC